MMKTKVVSKKLIKPYTPTPQSLKNYKLSFLDELSPPMEVGVLLFYRESNINRVEFEASLAKTLVQFYPLAGRYNKKYRSVHCSDQGADFVEAEALDVELNDAIAERNFEKLNGFFPYKNNKLIDDEFIDPILSIQTTELKCGGLVIGICVSHKVFDASSLGTFIAAWSSNSRSDSSSFSPIFDCSKLFPSKNQIDNIDVDDEEPEGSEQPKPSVKMFSFNSNAITSLRSKWGTSRVRAVSAVIGKALIGLDQAKHGGESRPCLAMQAVNIRGRTIPPLPKHSCGNLVIQSCVEARIESQEIEIKELVGKIGDAVDRTIIDCARILSTDENGFYDIVLKPVEDAYGKISSGEANVLWFSDWSKFGWYEVDFGWGKPLWTSIVAFPCSNIIILMGNKEGDGIEAWVHLDKNDMPLFEQDEGIRAFTT